MCWWLNHFTKLLCILRCPQTKPNDNQVNLTDRQQLTLFQLTLRSPRWKMTIISFKSPIFSFLEMNKHSSGTGQLRSALCRPGHRVQQQQQQQQQQQKRSSNRGERQLRDPSRRPIHWGRGQCSPHRSRAQSIGFGKKNDSRIIEEIFTTGYGIPLDDPVTTYDEPAVPASDSYGVINHHNVIV